MRKESGIIKTLTVFAPDKELTQLELRTAWGELTVAGIHKARTYVMRYRQGGYLERANRHVSPATYRLTAKGRELLETWEQEQMAVSPKRRSVPMTSTVTPLGLVNSVFALSLHLNKDCQV